MIVTQDEHLDNLVTNAYYREKEVYQYQMNVDNYTIMLTGLPQDVFPSGLVQHINAETQSLPFDMSDDDVQTIAQYQYRDKLRSLLRSEKVEQNKARLVLEALKAQIIASGLDYDIVIAEKKIVENAKLDIQSPVL
jgi:hypothetical protein